MTNTEIKRILTAHGIPHFTKDGVIYADSMISGTALFEKVEAVSGWSRLKLLHWLGY